MVVEAGMALVARVNPSPFLRSTSGLIRATWPVAVAPYPRLTSSSCNGTNTAKTSMTPTPVATGGATLRPMNNTADEGADSDADEQDSGRPNKIAIQQERHADIGHVNGSQGRDGEIVYARQRQDDENPCDKPILRSNRRGKDAFDKTVGARACDYSGRQRQENKRVQGSNRWCRSRLASYLA